MSLEATDSLKGLASYAQYNNLETTRTCEVGPTVAVNFRILEQCMFREIRKKYAKFNLFRKNEIGFREHHVLCESVYPHSTFECLQIGLWNLLRI
jgi:hypothetical protein